MRTEAPGRRADLGAEGVRSSRFDNVQGLRALASVLVVFVHLDVLLEPIGSWIADGVRFSAGVDLFFVISGFIMVLTTRGRAPSPAAFLGGRFLRIAPLYWLVTLATFAVALAAPRLLGGTTASWPDLVRSLLFIPYVRPDGLIRPVLFVGWSLNLEMLFYVLFAASLAVPGTARRAALLVAALLMLVVWHDRAAGRMGPVLGFLTQPLLLEFGLGVLVGVALPMLPRSRRAGWAAVGVAPAALAALLWPGPELTPLAPPTALPALALLLSALVAERAGLVVGSSRLLELGDASYSLYLTHPFATQAVTVAAAAAGNVGARTAPGLILLALALSVALAAVVHRRVERPLGRAARRLASGGRERPADRERAMS